MPLTIITLRKGDEMHTGSVLNKYRKYDYEQATHCMVCDLADSKRKNEDLLYRRLDDTQDCLYIQSKKPLDPRRVSDMGYDAQIVDIDSLLHALSCGDTVKILAKLAPTICVNGKKRSIDDPKKRIDWVHRKMAENGMTSIHVYEGNREYINFSHYHQEHTIDQEKRATRKQTPFILGVNYTIIATISDVNAFSNAVHKGIGRGKAYGCGLLLFRKIEN